MNIRLTFAISSILAACMPSPTTAAANPDRFDFLSITDGLSQSSVHCMIQDRHGYMWFGTEDGLNRYDGYRFTVYRHIAGDTTSLSDNYITALCLDSFGNLLVGTKTGVNVWNGTRGSFERILSPNPQAGVLMSGECTALATDMNGILWIGTPNGLIRYDHSTKAASLFVHDPLHEGSIGGNDVRCIYSDRDGILWIGSMERGRGRGLSRLDQRSGVLRTFPIPGNQNVWTICEDSSGTLLVGSYDGGLFVFDRRKEIFARFRNTAPTLSADRHTWSVWPSRHGGLWVGTGGGGLLRYRSGTGEPERYSLNDNYILSLYEDRSEVLWIGTGKGIQRYDIKNERFSQFSFVSPRAPSKREVWSFSADTDGSVWIGTSDGLCRRDARGIVQGIPGLSGFDVYSVCEDRDGTIWMATPNGLLSYNQSRKSRRWIRAGHPGTNTLSDFIVNALVLDRDENLWIGTASGGINKLNRKTGMVSRYYLESAGANKNRVGSNRINAIHDSRDGILWFGTDDGLFRFDPTTGTFAGYRNNPELKNSISPGRILSICEDHAGIFWIGTSGGLNRFDRTTGQFSVFGFTNGLPNDVVYAIEEDNLGCLWLSTNMGLSRFDPVHVVFRNYDERDGLQSREFNRGASLKIKEGEIFFGGINGFNSFFPERVVDNPYLPPVVITDFKVFDRSIGTPPSPAGNLEIELRHSQNFFSIEFAALDFSCPEKNKYEYKLEGFDNEWISCGTRRYAAYTNLDGGDYVFRVRGSNNDGVWNREGTAAVVRIIPPYWKSGWFRTAAVLAVGCAIVILIQLRFRRLKRRADAQQKMSQELIESQENERKRIGAGLHDSLGQNLLVIKNLAVMALEAGRNKKKTDEHLGNISSLASQALAEVRNISYDLRPYQLDRLGLTGALRSITSRVASSSQITFSEDLDNVDGLIPKRLEINLFRIVQEAVSNVVKHSKATGARVTVKRREDSVIITVTDNGIGFDEGRHGFGLTSLAERARILGGSMTVDSIPGSGTVITVILPMKKEQQ